MEKEWYKTIGFSENPFDTKRFFEIVGHHDTKHDLLYFIKASSLIFVEGGRGIGKTAILKYITDAWQGSEKVVYLNCKNVDKSFNINQFIMNSVGFLKKIFNKKPKNVVLLVDNAEYLTERNYERIKYLYDHSYVKSAVFTGTCYKDAPFSPSMKQRFTKRVISVREINKNDAVKIVRDRIGNGRLLSNEIIKDIFMRSRKNPKLFLQNCEKVCSTAIEEGKRRVHEDILKRVLPVKREVERILKTDFNESARGLVVAQARGHDEHVV